MRCGFGLVPISGTASEVVGIDSATRLRNTVNERRIVTPANETEKKETVGIGGVYCGGIPVDGQWKEIKSSGLTAEHRHPFVRFLD